MYPSSSSSGHDGERRRYHRNQDGGDDTDKRRRRERDVDVHSDSDDDGKGSGKESKDSRSHHRHTHRSSKYDKKERDRSRSRERIGTEHSRQHGSGRKDDGSSPSSNSSNDLGSYQKPNEREREHKPRNTEEQDRLNYICGRSREGQQDRSHDSKRTPAGGGSAPGISMKLAAPPPTKPSLPTPTIALAQKSSKVAAIFNDDDDEPEEMPPECKMRMKNVGRDTPTSAGPNSFGKTKLGFCNATHYN